MSVYRGGYNFHFENLFSTSFLFSLWYSFNTLRRQVNRSTEKEERYKEYTYVYNCADELNE